MELSQVISGHIISEPESWSGLFIRSPGRGKPGYESWPEGAWKYAGGVNDWSGMSLDKKEGWFSWHWDHLPTIFMALTEKEKIFTAIV